LVLAHTDRRARLAVVDGRAAVHGLASFPLDADTNNVAPAPSPSNAAIR